MISRLPEQEQAGELWDHVVGLARFPGFAELKRSLREQPQLVGFRGADPAPSASRRTGTAAVVDRGAERG